MASALAKRNNGSTVTGAGGSYVFVEGMANAEGHRMWSTILPGPRQARAPLISGLLTVFALVLLARGEVSELVDGSDARLSEVETILGPLGVGFVALVGLSVAYLVGLVATAAADYLVRIRYSHSKLPATSERISRAAADELEGYGADTLLGVLDRAASQDQFWVRVRTGWPENPLDEQSNRRSVRARAELLRRRLLTITVQDRISVMRASRRSREWWSRRKRLGLPATETFVAGDLKGLLARSVAVDGFVTAPTGLVRGRLLAVSKELYDVADRLIAESQFRSSVVLPGIACVWAATDVLQLGWPATVLVLLIALSVGWYLAISSTRLMIESGEIVVDAIYKQRITTPRLDTLRYACSVIQSSHGHGASSTAVEIYDASLQLALQPPEGLQTT